MFYRQMSRMIVLIEIGLDFLHRNRYSLYSTITNCFTLFSSIVSIEIFCMDLFALVLPFQP